ncbi:DUF4178 domain-containing protein [Nonomuraea ferruginea]|uniref:DUF4178 domain-containing protein n=1 Tax=Nonomuraea ferruginea TaxID=46174 RepID=UPI003622DC8F
MTSMVVLGLSIATVLLLLGAFLATLRQDRKDRTAVEQPVEVAPAEPPLPAPVAAAGHAGIDYTDPRTLRVGDKIEVLGSPVRVLGALYVSWQGQQWVEYRLRDGARRVQWLTVEMRKGQTPTSRRTWRCCSGPTCPPRAWSRRGAA